MEEKKTRDLMIETYAAFALFTPEKNDNLPRYTESTREANDRPNLAKREVVRSGAVNALDRGSIWLICSCFSVIF